MKVIITGAISRLKALAKFSKTFKDVRVEVVTEEGDNVVAPSTPVVSITDEETTEENAPLSEDGNTSESDKTNKSKTKTRNK